MKKGRFQHISPGKATVLAAFLAVPFHAGAQESLMSIGFGGILSHYSQIENSTPSVGFALKAQAPISPVFSLEAAAEYSRFVQGYDTPGGISALAIDVWSVDLGTDWRAIRLTETIELSTQAGIGFTNFHRNESVVSLGALGNLVLPPTNSAEEHLFLGLGVTKRITQQIGLEVGTRLRLLSPFAALETAYSIHGGLSIGLF